MSFADRIREELIAVPTKHPCCRRALLGGLLLGASADGDRVSVSYRQPATGNFAAEQIRARCGKAPEQNTRGISGHLFTDLSIASELLAGTVASMDGEGADAESVFRFSCENCRAAFLRGAFLACGTVNDPHKSFHMEFKLPSQPRADLLAAFLDGSGYPPKRALRAGAEGIYYKDSGSIEELMTIMGASHAVFDFINSRIERDIRNNENRATNCVARNIEKTICAAARQMDAINRLMEAGRLESLPEPIQETAMLRYRNPDVTLDELASLHEPALSRSGLNHRLQKLLDAAGELPNKGGNHA